jgi:flagellar biosynthesis protein FlhF
MHLKRYRTATVLEALTRARAELGPGALVLSTRLVRVAGPRGWLGAREVEVTVAAEREVSENRPDVEGFRHPNARTVDPIVARLEATGLESSFAREVAAAVPRRDRRGASPGGLRRALASRLGPSVAGYDTYAPVELFVGPPGAGKTTTVAKIAAQERARTGERLSMVAADGFRVGAVEQLQLYAEIIGNPFFVARTASDVQRAIEASDTPVLVDTAGRSPSDREAQELFDVLGRRAWGRTHLVMPAATTTRDAGRILDRFADSHLDCVALTRVDEADTLAPLVGLLRERRLPVSYLGTGQRVPEDLYRATPPLLAACMLGEGVDALETLR